ncbi:hypothetical protein [Actinokineospora sp. NBRC 105648]|uniref:hypothetical protein n=1 Tax=Actinokineospora sp. NBRC 105648 TaxID=3032206 RepID=UPI0024A2672B|nr:hypothetical protein [Actinokineospora sp. NBRC 105648]GLZ38745.1 hypothetical protein Acsp05_23690 [Actinokineospora sp. NBRC 105648]
MEPIPKSGWRRFRADRLRTELMISNTSALRDRKVRDSADHFDERIDDFVRDQCLPQSWTDLAEEEFTQHPAPFRAINPDTGEVLAGHDRMALTPIVTELNAVLRRCETIEPGSTSEPDVVMLLATLRWPPLPSLFAPTGRSDELVAAGASVTATGPESLEELITLVVDQLRAPGLEPTTRRRGIRDVEPGQPRPGACE